MRAVWMGLRILAREWRSGELGVLLLALIVAVASLTGVGFLVDRVDHAMQREASEVLGADLRLQSSHELSPGYAAQARTRGLRANHTTAMLSVVLHGDATQLANLYAVSAGYPLRGQVRAAAAAFGAPEATQDIPAPGEVWPDSRLMAALGAQPGDALGIGSATLRITRVLVSRPDQGSGFVDLAPSLLMNEADVPATALVRPGSRVTYALLFAGEPSATQPFTRWLAAHKQEGERLRDLREASPEVSNASQRATRFLSLASLAAVLLCAVSVAMTARRYVQRHLDIVALLKTLGATSGFALALSLAQLVCIALLATAIGAAAGLAGQAWLLKAVRGLVTVDLPAPGLAPIAVGGATAVLLLLGFALPSLRQLSRVPAVRILRRDTPPPRLGAVLAFGPAALAVAMLVGWTTRDAALSLWYLLALALIGGVLGGAGYLLVWATRGLRGRVGVSWRYGLANLARRSADSVVQIVAFGLGLTALLMLAVIRGDLISDWRASLPTSAPNYFFVNIPPEDRDAFAQFLHEQGGHITRMLPMIRARMTAINGVPMDQLRFPTGRGEGFGRREQNLSWSLELGEGNLITKGRWYTAADTGKPLVSVATDFEEAFGLKLGDQLSFDVAGEAFTVRIASFRRIKWDSLQPNFFLVFPPGLLEGTAGTYMTSAHYRPADAGSIARLVHRFPSVSVFDMDDLLNQLRSIIDKAVLAVQSVFVFTLLAGLTVLLAAVQASREDRRYESAVLRTLGASRRTVLQSVVVEFGAIGLLAGVLAASAATLGGYVLATRLLDVHYRFDAGLWIEGVAAGFGLVCAAGLLATRSALRQPPLASLRAY